MSLEIERQALKKEKDKNSYIVGLDMGITNFACDNVGNTYDAPKAVIKTYDKIYHPTQFGGKY